MNTKLYVGNLSYRATEEDLLKKFGEFGECVSANIVYDKFSGKSKGFAFVEMSTKEAAEEAVAKLTGTAMYGRGIIVNEANPRKDRKPGGRPRRF